MCGILSIPGIGKIIAEKTTVFDNFCFEAGKENLKKYLQNVAILCQKISFVCWQEKPSGTTSQMEFSSSIQRRTTHQQRCGPSQWSHAFFSDTLWEIKSPFDNLTRCWRRSRVSVAGTKNVKFNQEVHRAPFLQNEAFFLTSFPEKCIIWTKKKCFGSLEEQTSFFSKKGHCFENSFEINGLAFLLRAKRK